MNKTILFYMLGQSADENAIFQWCTHIDLVDISGLCGSRPLMELFIVGVLSRLNLRRQFVRLWLKVKS